MKMQKERGKVLVENALGFIIIFWYIRCVEISNLEVGEELGMWGRLEA